jgi:hypothetical protein
MKLSPDEGTQSWCEEGPNQIRRKCEPSAREVDTFIDAIKVVRIGIIQINLN